MPALGAHVKHLYTDFHGIVVAKIFYLHQTSEVKIQADGMRDGKPLEPVWLHVDEIVPYVPNSTGFVSDDIKRTIEQEKV